MNKEYTEIDKLTYQLKKILRSNKRNRRRHNERLRLAKVDRQDEDVIPDGWFPAEADAAMFQNLFKNNRPIGQIVKTNYGWRGYTLLELNSTKTGAKPIGDTSLATRDAAQAEVEEYLKRATDENIGDTNKR